MRMTDCWGRQEIALFIPPENSVLISMVDPNTDFPAYQGGWVDIMQLKFWDILRNKNYSGIFPQEFLDLSPSRENTKAMYDFIVQNQDRNIYAHCEAGISRSGAVREFLDRMGWEVQTKNRPIHPNSTILNDLLRSQMRLGAISY